MLKTMGCCLLTSCGCDDTFSDWQTRGWETLESVVEEVFIRPTKLSFLAADCGKHWIQIAMPIANRCPECNSSVAFGVEVLLDPLSG